jgi:hypothetical protein
VLGGIVVFAELEFGKCNRIQGVCRRASFERDFQTLEGVFQESRIAAGGQQFAHPQLRRGVLGIELSCAAVRKLLAADAILPAPRYAIPSQ